MKLSTYLLPLNIIIFTVAIFSCVMRPDFNVIVSMFASMVIRSGIKSHLKWLGWIYVFTIIVDIVWLSVFNHWEWGVGGWHFSVAMSIINLILKLFFVLISFLLVVQWNEEIAGVLSGSPTIPSSEQYQPSEQYNPNPMMSQ